MKEFKFKLSTGKVVTVKQQRKLPGEKQPFRDLTPPQHLEQGKIVSSRSTEVTAEDPLLARIRQLETENAELRAQLKALK